MNELKQLTGIHHVTAITSSAPKIYDFYTNVLGMRLVKKNVNQDDLTTYHLFFADDAGNPGTDMTFFDFKGIGPHIKGTNDISRTGFRVANDLALDYWVKRFDKYEIKHNGVSQMFGRKVLSFEDFDRQQYTLFSDENDQGVAAGTPWHKGPVPDEFAIIGLGPIFLTVNDAEYMHQVLNVMKMTKVASEEDYTLYETGFGGNGGSVIVKFDNKLPQARQGYGGVHHVAFRVDDKEHLDEWQAYFDKMSLPNSGHIDRFYFKSVYIRLYPNILFELATDGPGFIDDQETYENLGDTLTLPPHLRSKREYIEEHLPHFDTVRSNKVFEKEYL
ncbi:MAG: ring-cleaving dioxygenase [Erysipelothrix sp.]|nr:ring-cleaving dioxygenase [Erysipelothrix sp.]